MLACLALLGFEGLHCTQRQERARLEALKGPVLIQVNHASLHELMSLRGIGPVLAGRIQAARPLVSEADLAKIPGLTATRLRQIRHRIEYSSIQKR